MQQLTGDYPAAAASHQQALSLFGDLGERDGQAEALNSLGELSSRTSANQQALDYHRQALAIAHDIGAPAGGSTRPGRNRPLSSPRRRSPATESPTCGRHWRSTSASEPPMPSASRTPSHAQLARHPDPAHSEALGAAERAAPTAPVTMLACCGEFSTAPVRDTVALLAPASQLRQVEMLVERPRCPGPDSRDQVVASLRGTTDACEDRQGRPCRARPEPPADRPDARLA